MDVDLDAIGAHVEGAADGAEGIFRLMPAGAAMTDAEQMSCFLYFAGILALPMPVTGLNQRRPENLRKSASAVCTDGIVQNGERGDLGVRYEISRRADRLQQPKDLFNVVDRWLQHERYGFASQERTAFRGFAGSQWVAEGTGIRRDAHEAEIQPHGGKPTGSAPDRHFCHHADASDVKGGIANCMRKARD